MKEAPIRKAGERIVLSEELVQPDLLAKALAHRDGDGEEDEVESCQSQSEVQIERMEAGTDVGVDGPVRKVQLEDTDAPIVISGHERHVDLDGLPGRPLRCHCRPS